MKKQLYIIAILALIIGVSSCELLHDVNKPDDPETEYSSVYPISGEWYVEYNHNFYGHDPFGAGLTPLFTYNTVDDDGKNIWLTDEENFWEYKVKIPCDVPSLAFGGSDTVTSTIAGYPIKVLVRNGKIMKNASLQPSGTMTDSIYFEVWFEDLHEATGIIGDTLIVSGFRRTGFLEDEH